MSEWPVRRIKVGKRFRTDLGDLQVLADSIDRLGLLHPIVITPRGHLIAGQRRLEAVKLLRWRTVPVHVVDLENIVEGELAENVCRKDFLPSELWAIAKEIRQRVAIPVGRPKTGEIFPNYQEAGKSLDKAASYFGISGRTLDKIGQVVESGQSDLIEELDRTGKVDPAFELLQRRREAAQVAATSTAADNRLICGDCRKVLPTLKSDSFDGILSDPVFGIGFRYNGRKRRSTTRALLDVPGAIYRELLRVLRPGGFLALWQSQRHFPYFWEWFGPHIKIFAACKSYVQLFETPMNSAFDPLVCVWKPGAKPLRPVGQEKSHDWHVSNMQFDALAKQHPCVARWTFANT